MEQMKESVGFDRAAGIYDATRALPDDIIAGIRDGILAEIERVGADHVLDVGIGTGRIARPLAARGIQVRGVDISAKMLKRLLDQIDQRHRAPDLVFGDATRLPLADDSSPVILSFHVLHLVSDWEAACDEAWRVLETGGTFVHYRQGGEFNERRGGDAAGNPKWMESSEKWDELLLARDFVRRKRPTIEAIGEKLQSLGGSLRTLDVGVEVERITPNAVLKMTRERQHSWSWEIPDDVFWDCMPEYEEWMRARYADMDEVQLDHMVHELRFWTFD